MALFGALMIGLSPGAPAADFILPTPDNNTNATFGLYPDATGVLREAILMDGIPIAFKYDDFWSYSAHILESIQSVNPTLIPSATFGTYDFSTGTGVILVNLSSVAGGATNPFGLQDPVDLGGPGDNVTGWVCEWGGDPQYCNVYSPDLGNGTYSDLAANQGTTSTVGEMLTALQTIQPGATIPVFYADYNQTGAGDSLFASAQVRIIDGDGNVVAFWDLDTLTNDAWDQNLPTYNFGDITFTDAANCTPVWDPITGEGCAGVTDSGSTYTGSHNLGSGHADFMVFAETMDLSQFDSSFLFVVTLNVGCNPEGRSTGLVDPATGCYDPGLQHERVRRVRDHRRDRTNSNRPGAEFSGLARPCPRRTRIRAAAQVELSATHRAHDPATRRGFFCGSGISTPAMERRTR